jgi:tetratricopeptide (TPR) repeat protein
MSTSWIRNASALGLWLLLACRGTPTTPPAQPQAIAAAATRPSAAVPEPDPGPPGAEARALCLAEPDGATPVDAALRELQAGARQLGRRSDGWVLVGREWVRKARIATDPGFYLNVGACAAVALELEPAFVPAQELQGLVLMNDHAFAQARELASAILARDPENLVALGLLSDALLELGRYDEAARAAQRQMSARPGMAAHARGSYLRWLRGDTRGAKLFIKDALMGRDARDPEPAAWTFVEAAAIYWHQADYDGADAIYAEALRWLPDYPAALVGRARVALAKRQPHAAIPLLERAERVRPLAETAWLLGDARELAGDADGARQAYERAVVQGRRGDRLLLALFFATKNRDIDEALRLIEAERAGRGGIYVDDTYAWVLYRAARHAEARRASERALRLGTRDARLLYHAGAIRLASGETASGRALVREALSLNPGFDATGAVEARALLAREPERLAANR